MPHHDQEPDTSTGNCATQSPAEVSLHDQEPDTSTGNSGATRHERQDARLAQAEPGPGKGPTIPPAQPNPEGNDND